MMMQLTEMLLLLLIVMMMIQFTEIIPSYLQKPALLDMSHVLHQYLVDSGLRLGFRAKTGINYTVPVNDCVPCSVHYIVVVIGLQFS